MLFLPKFSSESVTHQLSQNKTRGYCNQFVDFLESLINVLSLTKHTFVYELKKIQI